MVPFSDFPKKIILKQLGRLEQKRRGLSLHDEVEYIHDARVAFRRLRTALTIFQNIFPKKSYKYWKKNIRRTAQSLGAVRDLDTEIAFLKEIKGDKKALGYKKGLETLLKILQDNRRCLTPEIQEAFGELKRKRILEEIKVFLKTRSQESLMDDKDSLAQLARKKVKKRLRGLLAYEPHVTQPEKIGELHKMRIAAKHLRYTLESFHDVYGPKIEEFTYAARSVQEALGDFHDAWVWMTTTPQVISKYISDQSLKKAANYFQNKCRVHHHQSYNEFIRLWQGLEKRETWKRLREFILHV